MAPLLAVGVLLSTLEVWTDRQHQGQDMAAAAQRLVGEIDGLLDARLKSLQVLAHSSAAQDSDLTEVYAQAQACRASFGGSVLLADAERHMLFTPREPLGTPCPCCRVPRAAGPLKRRSPAARDSAVSRAAKAAVDQVRFLPPPVL